MKKAYSFLLLFLLVSRMINGQSLQSLYERFGSAYSTQQYAESNRLMDSLLLLDPTNHYWWVYKSVVEAQLGHADAANRYLGQAIKDGYWYMNDLLQEEGLDPLRKTNEYTRLIGELTKTLTPYKLSEADQQMTIEVPPLMECYVIMLYLSNPTHALINDRQHHPYFKKIDDFFAPFKQHPLLLKLAKKYPGTSQEWITNLRAHHNLRTFYPYDSLDIDSIRRFPIELDRPLATLVRDFAVETNFMAFYQSNKEFYDAMKKIMYTNYSFGSQLIPFFNQNFSTRINRFNVYFSPIYGGWQHGPTASLSDYTECFYFGGIMYTDTHDFYYPDVNLLFTLLTEFDHTTVNALTKKYSVELDKYTDKTGLLNTSGKVSYGSLISTLNEYITWAFALQYFYENTPAEYPELERNIVYSMEKGRGFARFGEFMEFYKGYIHNRKKYPMLIDFYPEIINWLEQI